MRKINIRAFRANMLEELGTLPFELTRSGKGIALVSEMGVPGKKENSEKPVKLNGLKGLGRTKKPMKPEGWVNPVANSILGPKGEK